MKYFFKIVEDIFLSTKARNIAIDRPKNTYLEVPYSQKNLAKTHGARWDSTKKKWFISNNLDITLFEQWLPCKKANFRAEYFYFAQTSTCCYKCCKDTQVSAIILPEGFEAVDEQAIDDLEAREDSVEITPFCSQDYLSLVSYITYISPEALDEIDKFTNYIFFQKSYSSATGYSYYRSLCQHCNSAQGDNYIISEYNSAFFPIDVDKFTKIKFYKINKYIEVCAGSNSIGYSSDNQFRRSNIYNNSKL